MREDESSSNNDQPVVADATGEPLIDQLSRLQNQLEKLEERFKSHDDRLASIESSQQNIESNQSEIIVKLNELQTIIESLADRSDQNNNNNNNNNLQNNPKIHQSLFDDERPNSPVQLGDGQQVLNSQHEVNQQDQNNNNCAGRMSAASSSLDSSRSMSPIESNTNQSQTTHTSSHHHHLQQSHQNPNNISLSCNNNNNNNISNNTHQHLQHQTSLHQSLLQNLQQQHPELARRASLQHQFHGLGGQQQPQHHAQNNGHPHHQSGNNGGQTTGSRLSSGSASPSLGHSAPSTSANSPMLESPANSLGGHLSGSHHQQQSNGISSQHHLATAQQILQAAAAAQQSQHNSQQDPNMAALAASQFLSALGRLSAGQGVGALGGGAGADGNPNDPESLLAQSRLLASTLSAAAGTNAGDLGSQMAAAVVAAAAKSGGTLPAGLNLGHHTNGSGPNHQTSASSGLPTGQSSPLIPCQNHHPVSHNTNQHNNNNQQHPHSHSTGSSPVSAAAAMAAQLSAVAAAAAHHQQQQQQQHHQQHQHSASQQLLALPLTSSSGLSSSPFLNGSGSGHLASSQANSVGAPGQLVNSIPHPHSHHALSHPSSASLLMNNPHYQTVRTKYSTRRYSRRRVGPEEAMADPAIRATAQLKMPVVPKTILIVLRHRLTVQTAITLACARTGERLRKGAIQKKLEAMFREPGAVDAFLNEWDHPNAAR